MIAANSLKERWFIDFREKPLLFNSGKVQRPWQSICNKKLSLLLLKYLTRTEEWVIFGFTFDHLHGMGVVFIFP